jgi:hypothetical protein
MKTEKKVGVGIGLAGLGYGIYRFVKWLIGKPAKPPVSGITLSNLTITPTTVYPNETVAISVLATNSSASALDYTVKLTGDFTDSQAITLDGGASQTVSFTVTPTAERTYTVYVDSLHGRFICTSAPHGDIVLSNLVISPTTCTEGDTVTISVTATNQGNANEVMAVTLNLVGSKYSDTWQDVQQIILEPGASQTVAFTFQPTVAETYSVTVDSLSGSFVVNPAQTWPGWTVDTVVYGVTVSPSVAYVGETVDIAVDIEGPWPATYPMDIQGTVNVNGETLSNTFTITFRNPALHFSYLTKTVGTFTVTAQDKSATLTVLASAVGTYYSPFGGKRFPLCTDIVVPGVPAFTLRHGTTGAIVFSWPGGDLKYSDIVSATSKGQWPTRNPATLFPFWSIEGLAMPSEVTSRLPYAQPIAWNPTDATISNYQMVNGPNLFPTSQIPIPYVIIVASNYTCKEYWGSKDELASVIAYFDSSKWLNGLAGVGDNFELNVGIRDWVYYPGIKSSCFQGYCDFWATCPYCGAKIGISHISTTDYVLQNGALSIARSLLQHIETAHPDRPLTSPASF